MATLTLIDSCNLDSLPIKNVTNATWATNNATLTIPGNSLNVGNSVVVSGITPAGYNGTWTITAVSVANQTITYVVGANPGSYVSGGTVQCTWDTGDNIVINNGAVVTVDTNQTKFAGTNGSNNIDPITINNGKLVISNSSNSTHIRFGVKQIAAAAFIRRINIINGLGSVEINGAPIEIGTGSGSPGQTMTLPAASYFSCVFVETAANSGVYEPWLNVAESSTPTLCSLSGMNWIAGDDRGKVFAQTPSDVTNITKTGSSADDLWTTTITFGDGVNGGKLVPTGAKVLVPNITITDMSMRTSYLINDYTRWCAFTMASGGKMSANWANFEYSYLNTAQAQALTLTNCSICVPPNISECYAVNIDNIGIGRGPTIPYYSSGWNYYSIYTAFLGGIVWSSISGAVLKNIYTFCPIGSQGEGQTYAADWAWLTISYSDDFSLDNLSVMCQTKKQQTYALKLTYCNRATLSNIKAYGLGAINFLGSSDCTINGVTWCPTLVDSGYISGVYASIIRDPATGNRLVNGTRYYVKLLTRSRHTDTKSYDVDQEGYYLSNRVYSATPYSGETNHPFWFGATPTSNAVVLRWPRRDPSPTLYVFPTGAVTSSGTTVTLQLPVGHNYVTGDTIIIAGASQAAYNGTWTVTSHAATNITYTMGSTATTPATGNITIILGQKYQIFRSTSWGTLGSLLGQINTVQGAAISGTDVYMELYNDTTAVNGTTYFYTLRKWDAPSVYTDSVQVEATPTAVESVTNLCLQSADFTNATWTKNSVTVTGDTVRFPSNAVLTSTGAAGDTLTPTSSDSSVTQAITGITAGQAYTFSIEMRLVAATTTNPVTTLELACIDNGSSPQTVTTTVTLTSRPRRYWLTITPSAGSTQITVRIGGNSSFSTGKIIGAHGAQLNLGSTPGPYVGPTTTTSLSRNPRYFEVGTTTSNTSTTGGIVAVSAYGGQEIGLFMDAMPANGGVHPWSEIHISTNRNFTPSLQTLVWSDFFTALLIESASWPVRFQSGSNNNVCYDVNHYGNAGTYGSSMLRVDACANSKFIRGSFNFQGCGMWSAFAENTTTTTANKMLVHDFSLTGISKYAKRFSAANTIFASSNNNGNVTLQNIRGDSYTPTMQMLPFNSIVKGVFGTKLFNKFNLSYKQLYMGANPTGAIDLAGVAVPGTIFYENYTDTTEGGLTISCQPVTSGTPPYTILSGSPAFQSDGSLLFSNPGDSIEWVWPHYILGVTGFREMDLGGITGTLPYIGSGPTPAALGDATDEDGSRRLGCIKLEYALDTGSGFGALKRLTSANLLGETVSATNGFKLKLRMTAMQTIPFSARSTAFVQGETINGQTSGATAVISEIVNAGPTTGHLWVTSVSGSWAASENIRSGSTVRAVTVASPNQILPIYNQSSANTRVYGIRILTTVDQSVKYSASLNTITVNNIVSGSRILIRRTDTNAVFANAIVNTTSYVLTYDSTSSFPVEIILRKASAAPYYKQWRSTATLSSSDQSITALQETD